MEREQYALMLTSGDLPEGILRWAPDYYGILQKDEEFYREVSDYEGRLCFFGAYKYGGDVPFERPILRVDVLQGQSGKY